MENPISQAEGRLRRSAGQISLRRFRATRLSTTGGGHATLWASLLLALFFLLLGSVSSAQVWSSNGPEGGRILALAIDPGNPTTVYAGTFLGGVFKSTDGAASWRAINNGLTSL